MQVKIHQYSDGLFGHREFFTLLVRLVIMSAFQLQSPHQKNILKPDTLVSIYTIFYIHYFPGSQLSCVRYIDIVCFSKNVLTCQTGEKCG